MTDKQKKQFNKMRTALRKIMRYQTVNQLNKLSQKQYGLEPTEAIEMAYENIREDAQTAVSGICSIK